MKKQRALPWQRRQRALLLVVLGVAVVLVLPVVMAKSYTRHRAEEENAVLRARGIPTSLEEIRKACPMPPEGQNAAPAYRKSFEFMPRGQLKPSYDDIAKKHLAVAPLQNRLPEDLREMIRAHLASNAEFLRHLHEAAKYPDCGFGIEPFNEDLPFLNWFRQGVRLLGLESRLAAEDGDPQRATEALLAALATGRSLRNEPCLMVHLLRIVANGITTDALRYTLATASLSDGQLAQLQAAMRAADDPAGLTRALTAERVLALKYFDRPERFAMEFSQQLEWLDAVPGGAATVFRTTNMFGWGEFDRVRVMRVMNEMIRASQLPYPDMLGSMSSIERDLSDDMSLVPRVSDLLLPGLPRLGESFARDAAWLRTAQTALAVERYELMHGTLPEVLDDLVPTFINAIPADPFDGSRLRYRTSNRGYVVYSVYANRIDNGGHGEVSNPDTRQVGDLVFRMEAE